MIHLDKVNKVYRTHRLETQALANISLNIEAGELVSIMGPSGCGKSTLLSIMGLLDEPSEGTVAIAGEAVRSYDDRSLAHLRNRMIGFVFQSFHLIPDLSVVDNVEIPLLYRRMPGKERRARALEALEQVGLGSRTDHYPTQLSGGQQQRVAIARAIVGEPRLLLADEPTGNLDSHMGEEVMGILEALSTDGTTVVMVTHDQRLAERTGRILRLFDGRQIN